MKKWAQILYFYFLYQLIWSISYYKTKSARYLSECINCSWNVSFSFIRFQLNQYVLYVQYEQLNLRFTAPISRLLSNQSIPSQITDTTDRQTKVPSAARSTDCMDIANSSELPVAQWTWYVHDVSDSEQTGRTSGKCRFVRRFMVCTVHWKLLRVSNKGKGDG